MASVFLVQVLTHSCQEDSYETMCPWLSLKWVGGWANQSFDMLRHGETSP